MLHQFLLFVIFLALFPLAFAHPIDISSTNLTVQGPHINGSVTLHSYQAQRLLRQKNIEFLGVESYFTHRKILEDYLMSAMSFQESGVVCPIQTIAIIEKDTPAIIGQGLDFTFFARCPDTIRQLKIFVTLFPSFPLQTNRLTLFAGPGLQTTPHTYKIFTVKNTEATVDVSVQGTTCVDTDYDGLCDTDEDAFRTDSANWDTDGDCYSDWDEIYNSRNPLSRELSPGQVPRDVCTPPVANTSSGQVFSSSGSANLDRNSYVSGGGMQFGIGYLTQVLDKIYRYTQNEKLPLREILFTVVLLGFVHAIGPGHAKNLMTTYLLDGKKGYGHGVLFALFFALTHISDLFLLFFGVYLFRLFADPTPYMPYVQFGSTIILFLYSVVFFLRAIRKFGKETEDEDGVTGSSIWQTLWVAFISGLAPCTFGWSVFLLLFSLGRLDLIIPLLFALTLGIYLCLQLIAIIVIYSKKAITGRFVRFAQWSSVISFGGLCVISIWMLWNFTVAIW